MIIWNYHDRGDLTINPTKGNCAFRSGKEKWGFNANKFNLDRNTMIQKYYDATVKKWTKKVKKSKWITIEKSFLCFYYGTIELL